MAEEPILCFDGDRAGRKAAYRAIDMALPLIGPGRSLGFALLPEGEDPDDLVHSGGREAIAQLLARALPLADLIWIRETENKVFAKPERRAGLERRFGEISRAIRDEALRRHYQAAFKERFFQFFGRRRLWPHCGGGQRRGCSWAQTRVEKVKRAKKQFGGGAVGQSEPREIPLVSPGKA